MRSGASVLATLCFLATQGGCLYLSKQADRGLMGRATAERIYQNRLTRKEVLALLGPPGSSGEEKSSPNPPPDEDSQLSYAFLYRANDRLFLLIPLQTDEWKTSLTLWFREGRLHRLIYEGPDGRAEFGNP